MTKNRIRSTRYSVFYVKVIILPIAFALSVLFAASPWGKHLELLCYDALFMLRGGRSPSEQVVVVAIDEPSFGVLRQKWPWPRKRHAELLEKLFQEGARVVALDILFAEPSDAESDYQLSRTVRSHTGAVMAASLELIDAPDYLHGTVVYPLPSLISEKTGIGIINLPLDSDGFVRRAFLSYGAVPSISLAAVTAFLSSEGEELRGPNESVSNEVMINYAGPPRKIPTVSYYQALDPDRYLPKNIFRDKLVFVGLSLHTTPEVDTPVSDHFFFPFSRNGSNVISGVEIQATLADNLLAGNYILPLPRDVVWSCLIWIAGFGLLISFRPAPALVVTGCLAFALLLTIHYLFLFRNIFLSPLFTLFPLLAGCIVLPFPHLLTMRRDRKYIRDAFSKYVSPKVVGKLMEDPGRLHPGGHMVNASVLYLDIAGFSRMAANMAPERLVSELSRHLGDFTETIINWDGMVDKFVGDAVMAIWGAPLPQADHAIRACRAALEIRRNLDLLHPEAPPGTEGAMEIRIGINSGEMLAGNVGGRHFLNYTVHGDATNMAVRLEALNKRYGTQILIGQGTAERIGDEFVIREIDRIRVDSASGSVALYELMGLSADTDIELKQRIQLYEAARRLYLNRGFEAAEEGFLKILARYDTDCPSRVYLERCRQYRQSPPPDDWDGVSDVRLK